MTGYKIPSIKEILPLLHDHDIFDHLVIFPASKIPKATSRIGNETVITIVDTLYWIDNGLCYGALFKDW